LCDRKEDQLPSLTYSKMRLLIIRNLLKTRGNFINGTNKSLIINRALSNEIKKSDDTIEAIRKKIDENPLTPIKVDKSELDKHEWERSTRTVSSKVVVQNKTLDFILLNVSTQPALLLQEFFAFSVFSMAETIKTPCMINFSFMCLHLS
jgi:hypothetical protein